MHSDDSTEQVPQIKEKLSEAELFEEDSSTDLENATKEVPAPLAQEDDIEYPTGLKLALIILGDFIAIFLVALDRTIIATAIPRITDQFHSLNDIGWYAGVYLITTASTQLIWGRIFTFYATKPTFLVAIIIFEIGSTICGAAPNSIAFIFGRAIAGLGSAGILSATTLLLTQVVPLGKRPVYIGMIGGLFGIASVVGPLLGGAFTDSNATWRWCFYINLPLGAITIAVLTFILKAKPIADSSTTREKIARLDPWGTLVFLPGIICFLLALQWGGSTYPWNDARIIALFVLSGVLVIVFIGIQIWQQENATIPPRIMAHRNVYVGLVYVILVGGALISLLYALPIWFQAIKGTTAVQSGIDTVPMILSLVVGTMVSGIVITKTGWYNPWIFFSVIMMSIGAGLITTFKTDTGHAKWIGYQVIFGLGLGTGLQQGSLGVQAVLKQKDVAIGISIMMFAQSFGGSIFVSIAQTLFDNNLIARLNQVANINPATVLAAGATGVRNIVPPAELPAVLFAYNAALTRSFYVTLGVSCFALIPAVGFQWVNVKGKKHG